jgi:3-oxoacyl-[acyl-carrier protein] reductase
MIVSPSPSAALDLQRAPGGGNPGGLRGARDLTPKVAEFTAGRDRFGRALRRLAGAGHGSLPVAPPEPDGAGSSRSGREEAVRLPPSGSARLHLASRTRAKLKAVAEELTTDSAPDVAEVDVDDYSAVQRHADRVLAAAGRIDISFNAVGMDDVQGIPLYEMQLEDFMLPITQAARRHFNTTTVAAKRMIAQHSGVIVMLTSSAAREWRHRMGGFSLGCAAIEALNRTLAGDLAGTGIRTVCIRANFTPETAPDAPSETLEPLLADTLVPRLPRLSDVGAAAVYAASDAAGATTGAILDLTCGAIVA